MAEPEEQAIALKKPLFVRQDRPVAVLRSMGDASSLCQCDFDELLGVHVAGLCDSLRRSPVFSRG